MNVADLPKRIADKIEVQGGCWIWTAWTEKRAPGKLCYGKVWWEGTMRYAHRIVYSILVGPIPEGKQLDHVKDRGCVGPPCVNPNHLEPVTAAENVRRGNTGQNMATKTHCPRNHEYTEQNTYRPPGRPNVRHCRQCAKERVRG